jgi:glucose 1-dehydrogenase
MNTSGVVLTVQTQPAADVVSSEVLQDRWAVVTGGSKGIGSGIAEALLAAGAHVTLIARGADQLAATAAELRAAYPGRHVRTLAADTSKPEDLAAMFAELDETLPALDVLIANAGWGTIRPFLEVPLAEWQEQLALNLTGTFLAMQWAGRRMRASVDGSDRSILVISSIRALGARPGRAPYSATKAALNQLVRVAALELAPDGIRVNTLSPGITATPMALRDNPEIYAEATAAVPMGRSGTPLDMGAAAVYLSSPQARFVTGANLIVDGGESLT